MCGINGVLRLSAAAPPIDRAELLRVRDAMAARGPDGTGEWFSFDGLAAFGHRRLAIIDLTPSAGQPMTSPDGRFTIVFNGEIYNYRELRRELASDGVVFRSQSDTEVILALFAREGLASLARLRGMFAIAVWDASSRRLSLARDPYGIKPLYYAVDRATLRFASQVRALSLSGSLSGEIEPAGLVGFLLWGSVPEPHTIRRGVRALPAGHTIEVENGRVGAPRLIAPTSGAILPAGAAIEDSVRAHLVSEVPVGLLLSAGLDSGLVAAMACRHLPERPVSMTLAFEAFRGTPEDEAPLAASVARTLGTRHVERRFTAQELADLWPAALGAMDQPSIDGFNTFLVSRVAREQGLKVVLSGLGGDEIFGSYPSFRDVPRWTRWAARGARLPGLVRAWPSLAAVAARDRPKLRGFLDHGRDLPGAYFLRRGLFLPEELPGILGPERAAEGLAAYDPVADARRAVGEVAEPWLAVQRLESSLYLRNQLLRDADWASMAHSVELRVPFVDASLRTHLMATGFEPARTRGKAALVRDLAAGLPEALFTRRKSGFSVPIPGPEERPAGLRSRRQSREILSAFTGAPQAAS